MHRWLALGLLAAGCSRAGGAVPVDAGDARCSSRATRTPTDGICLDLPPEYQLVRREQEPAFDRRVYGYDRPGEHPAEIRLDIQWFPRGRDPAAEEADYATEAAHLAPDGGDLEFDSSTDGAGGRFLRVRLRRPSGEANQARALIRTPHYRVRCAVDLEGMAEPAILDACRTLTAPP